MKRIFSVLLCFSLFLSLLPVSGAAFQTDVENISVAVGSVTLPLAEYPVGSKCIGTSGSTYYPLPDGGRVCVYGWECYGFARYVFYRCFGVVDCTYAGGKGYYSAVSDVPASDITVSYLKSIFGSKVLAGAHIRVGYDTSASNGHSMIYLACDEDYIYTYEGNYDHNCGVTVNQRTWQEFADYCKKKGRIEFIHMPDHYPTPPCEGCPGAGFSDMPASDNWAHPGMHFMLETGLFAGTSATTVSPNMKMSRAMLVTVLWRMAGAQESDGASGFADVSPTDWFAPAAQWAANAGIVSGTGEGLFSPEMTVTREQIAVILHRYVTMQEQETEEYLDTGAILGGYPDCNRVSGWAADDLAWAICKGLLSGKQVGEQIVLDAMAGATRAEVAAIFLHFCTEE